MIRQIDTRSGTRRPDQQRPDLLERKTLDLPRVGPKAYFQRVITLVCLATRVLLLLALFTVSFVIGFGTPETGAIEKLVLVALIGGCVFLAAKVSTLATKAQARLQRH